ncbi:hypothetical protein NP493_986g00001 [Ridgeia piscesae]|uniref:Uncharacterized protein n=1 Tax=Ridgeia piscesae TaxID=27915 RepID=A0AAD9KJ05_RIDPI|nr:hypothetical protein NP493_986g00001 [Ridgeia piscesae]
MPTGAFSVLGVDGSFGSALIPLFRAKRRHEDGHISGGSTSPDAPPAEFAGKWLEEELSGLTQIRCEVYGVWCIWQQATRTVKATVSSKQHMRQMDMVGIKTVLCGNTRDDSVRAIIGENRRRNQVAEQFG